MQLTPGAFLAHYEILSLLGSGGMGTVYLARDTTLNRRVALKFLLAAAETDALVRQRFLREAQAAGALDHPNIATIYEAGEHGGRPFIAMAYCPGETLKARIARGPLPIAETASILAQVADGLAAAHANGIVHRDLKPANIMIGPDGLARILDFGLAKMVGPDLDTATLATAAGTVVGTLAYISPEQFRGEEPDAAADMWALGVTAYEMLAGRLPFGGANAASVMRGVLEETPVRLATARPDAPPELVGLAESALQKDRNRRRLTAVDAVVLAKAALARLTGPKVTVTSGPKRGWILALSLIAIGIAVPLWLWRQQAGKVRWARETALPRIEELAARRGYTEAFQLAERAAPSLTGDRQFDKALAAVSRTISIDSVPEGADVRYRPYGADDSSWRFLARTPVRGARIPLGLLEWHITKPGYTTIEDVGLQAPYLTIRERAPQVPHAYVLEPQGHAPPGMVRASPRGPQLLAIAGLEHVAPFELGGYWIDRFEVSNREYKRFVDSGGYANERFWKQPFMKEGRTLPFDSAMRMFLDTTGRPGPATWEFGSYPEGKEEEPVGGVSWYEAAAYAEFSGKSLPTIFHWSHVADRRATSEVLLPRGRFHADGPLPVGHSGARSRYGTVDLAGNVKEWCWNEAGGGRRYTLGGGWSDPAYYFNDADGRSPWDRGPAFGFRCMKAVPGEPVAEDLFRPVEFIRRDFSREHPVNDGVFQAFLSLYSYDRGELAIMQESVDDSPRDWRWEVVSFNAAYGNERLAAHVLLPKTSSPPYQTLVYFPGINALHQQSSRAGVERLLEEMDFVLRSGRAIAMPVLQGTHERMTELRSDFPATTTLYRDHVVMWSKDVQRTVDYLLTRADIDRDKIGYAGRSWGGAMGTIMVATEPRFKVALFFVGGFYSQRGRPEVEAINFAPHVRIPSLMLNGRYDFFFPEDTSQLIMYRLIGVPESQKRRVVYDTSHSLPRAETIKETTAWLDRYLGPVATR